jgi:hypothetical protein
MVQPIRNNLRTKFFTLLTDISDIGGGPAGATGNFLCHVEGPDHAPRTEYRRHHAGHDMFSEDPVSAESGIRSTLARPGGVEAASRGYTATSTDQRI